MWTTKKEISRVSSVDYEEVNESYRVSNGLRLKESPRASSGLGKTKRERERASSGDQQESHIKPITHLRRPVVR